MLICGFNFTVKAGIFIAVICHFITYLIRRNGQGSEKRVHMTLLTEQLFDISAQQTWQK